MRHSRIGLRSVQEWCDLQDRRRAARDRRVASLVSRLRTGLGLDKAGKPTKVGVTYRSSKRGQKWPTVRHDEEFGIVEVCFDEERRVLLKGLYDGTSWGSLGTLLPDEEDHLRLLLGEFERAVSDEESPLIAA